MTKKENQKLILLTFDYELFFEKSGTLENSILKPVNDLIDVFDRHGVRATFFIDVLHYIRAMDDARTRDSAKLIKEQLQVLVSKGHRIELHLHPHWLDAKFEDGEWLFPSYRYYRLQNLPEEKITDLFISGVEVLEDIAKEVDPTYKVIAFRAGGWCIQPFDKLKEGFIKSGIKVDSTVARGMKAKTDIHYYDFIEAPRSEFYRFSDDPIQIDDNGLFYEIPITLFDKNLADKVISKITKYLRAQDFRIYGDGAWIGSNIGQVDKPSLLKRLASSEEMFSLQDATPAVLARKVNSTGNLLVNVISHPKRLSQISFVAVERLFTRKCNNFVNILEAFEQIQGPQKLG